MIIELKDISSCSKELKWEADCIDLPGSPIVGRGKTKYEALADLYINILFFYRNDPNMNYLYFVLSENGKVISEINLST